MDSGQTQNEQVPVLCVLLLCHKLTHDLDWDIVCNLHNSMLNILVKEKEEGEEEEEEEEDIAVYNTADPSAEPTFLYFNQLTSLPLDSLTWSEILLQVSERI